MENASKALLIAGAILLAILIIAIGMFIYNSANSTIQDSMTNMSTQEIEAFNNEFNTYKGYQTGSQISSLMNKLIAHSNTYNEDTAKIPNVYFPDKVSATVDASNADRPTQAGNTTAYVSLLNNYKNKVEAKHTYYVICDSNTSGLISDIYIYYHNKKDGTANSNLHNVDGF